MPAPNAFDLLTVADRIAAHATATRHRALGLGAAVDALGWRGLAADAFEAGAAGVGYALRSSANRLDDAADALRQHASHVATVLHTLHELADDLAVVGLDDARLAEDLVRHPGRLLHDGGSLVRHGWHAVGTALDVVGAWL